jgi:hypothetical protein
MLDYLKHIEWKLVFLALLACYVAPAFLVGTVFAVVLHEAFPSQTGQALASFVSFVALLAPSMVGGYVAARFAQHLPWLQVLAVGVLGSAFSVAFFRASPRAMVVYALACIVLAGFGGFVRLRAVRRDEA